MIARLLAAGLFGAGLMFGAGAASAQGDGSPGMDELAASLDEEDDDDVDARAEMENYESRIDKNEGRLDDHEARLRALEEQLRRQGPNE